MEIAVGGDSMEPTLREGDRVEVVRADPASLEPGDLVVFRAGDQLVIHRLLRKGHRSFLEMGDNRASGAEYPWPEALGKVRAILADGGRVDLGDGNQRSRARARAARSLRRHRAERIASRLPGCLLPRLLRGLARRVL